jgi:hypothetical protein
MCSNLLTKTDGIEEAGANKVYQPTPPFPYSIIKNKKKTTPPLIFSLIQSVVLLDLLTGLSEV